MKFLLVILKLILSQSKILNLMRTSQKNLATKSFQEKQTRLFQCMSQTERLDQSGKAVIKLALKLLILMVVLKKAEDERASRGLSVVVHPLIAEAATQFNARAVAELYPSGGPVKTIIIGDPDEETEEQARRVKDFMNYQITQEMPEYFPDLDQMLFSLPLVGQAFKKVWWDANLERQCSKFVKAEDFVVSPESTDLYTSLRYTHVIRMPRNDYNRYVEAGWYLPTEYSGDSFDPSGDTTSEIEGISPSGERSV